MGVVSRLTATAPPGGRRRTSNPGWPRGPPPVGASRRDLPTGCARRSPERSPGDGGSIPPTSTFSALFELGREQRAANTYENSVRPTPRPWIPPGCERDSLYRVRPRCGRSAAEDRLFDSVELAAATGRYRF